MAEQLRARAELPKDPNVLVEDHVLPEPAGPDLPIRIYTPRAGHLRLEPWSSSMVAVTCWALSTTKSSVAYISLRGSIAWSSVPITALLQSTRSRRLLMLLSHSLLACGRRGAPWCRRWAHCGRGDQFRRWLAASVAQRHAMSMAQTLPCNFFFTRLSTLGSGPYRMPGSQTRHYGTPIVTELCGSYYLAESDYPASYAAPALAESFEGLPAAMLAVAEMDPLRDEALEYASALLKANVSVELHLYTGTYHAFDYIAPFAQSFPDALSPIK